MKQALWLLLLVIVGVIAAFAQLDRQSRYDAQLEAFVPDIMAGFALEQRAEAALERGDDTAAQLQARALLARRPMPASHLRMLAEAHLLSGDNDAASTAIQMAGQRGWRDPVSQRTMLAASQEAGDHVGAARRYFALWIVAPNRSQLAPVAAEILAHPDARAEAARLLSSRKIWQRSFICDGLPQLPRAHAADIQRQLEARGAAANCAATNQ
ncbi:MAG: hypothetical protein ABJ242_02300 [Marinomonas sp.]